MCSCCTSASSAVNNLWRRGVNSSRSLQENTAVAAQRRYFIIKGLETDWCLNSWSSVSQRDVSVSRASPQGQSTPRLPKSYELIPLMGLFRGCVCLRICSQTAQTLMLFQGDWTRIFPGEITWGCRKTVSLAPRCKRQAMISTHRLYSSQWRHLSLGSAEQRAHRAHDLA